jgi:hypothetical protein
VRRAGAPKSGETESVPVDPLRIREMTSAERSALIARVLDDHPHLIELVPERLRPLPSEG